MYHHNARYNIVWTFISACGNKLGRADSAATDLVDYLKSQDWVKRIEQDKRSGVFEMKIMKRVCLVFVFLLIMLIALCLCDFFVYRPVDMVYLGSAKGTWDSDFYFAPKRCMENDFLYYNMGYAILDEDVVNRCGMSDFDFQLEKKEGKICIYSYGFPIVRLMYDKTRTSRLGHYYYNKAVFSKDKFQDGIYYFYETDYIKIGDWMEYIECDFLSYRLEEEDRDESKQVLGVLLIVFCLMCCLDMNVPIHRFGLFILMFFLMRYLFR